MNFRPYLSYIGKHALSAFTFSLFSLLFIGAIVYASINWPGTPAGETDGGLFNKYFSNMFKPTCKDAGQVIAGFDTDGNPICVAGGSWGSGNGNLAWQDVPLSDTADFDTQCEYRIDIGDEVTSGAKWRSATGLGSSYLFFWFGQYPSYTGMRLSKWDKTKVSNGLSVAKLEKRCNSTSSSKVAEIYGLDSSKWPNFISCHYSGENAVTGQLYSYRPTTRQITYLIGSEHQVFFNIDTSLITTNPYGDCTIGTSITSLINSGRTGN